jgi:hypothetical protein
MLVTSCYIQETSFKDKSPDSPSISIRLKNPDSERLMFFVIDENNNPKSQFRQFFNMNGSGENICDLLIYYTDNNIGENSLTITESKGTDFDKAADQIINTYSKLKSKKEFCSNSYCKGLILKACCVSKRAKVVGMDDKKKKAERRVIEKTGLKSKDCAFIKPEELYNFINSTKTSRIRRK